MHFKSLSDWMRAPGGRHLDITEFDVLGIKSAQISRTYRFNALYKEWLSKKAQGYTHKTWVTVGDDKTRDAYQAANGQKVQIDDMFIVGGEKLLLPSDVTGSFEQTMNCRCKVHYDKHLADDDSIEGQSEEDTSSPSTTVLLPPFGQTQPTQKLPARFIVNLDEHEGGRHFGHTKRDHVGKSDAQLRRLMEKPRQRRALVNRFRGSHGTFSSVQEGNKWVGAVLNRNREVIERYIESEGRELLKFDEYFGARTGREAYRPEKYSTRFRHRRLSALRFRNTTAVRVTILKSDEHRWGIAIVTAFPFQP